ncbi:MAG: hypothetical protein FMNOHCHN_03817 [Ignavibacteriaceae bacterium]|nr:hypothetical protein [Ignavibacteriaceae bacterium]
MPLYPTEVQVNDQLLAKLRTAYSKSYKRIINEIATASNFGVANRKRILKQIEDELSKLGVDYTTSFKKEIERVYKLGANDAVSQLNNVKAPVDVDSGFNRIHKEAIAALVDDTSTAFGEALNGVYRQSNALLGKAVRESITQKMVEGTITGAGLDQVRKEIKGILQEQGISSIIDRGGKQWSLDTYAEMLFRTKTVEARNRGLANRMVENGYDLVQVSSHFSTHYECAVWEGKILSLRGETGGYPTVAEAEAAGLFHPNCQHAINALIPSLARQTFAYDPSTATLVVDDGKYAKAALNSMIRQQSGGVNLSEFTVKAGPAMKRTFGYDTGRFKGAPIKPLPLAKKDLQPMADFANRFDTVTDFQRFVGLNNKNAELLKLVKQNGYKDVGAFYKDAVAGREAVFKRNESIQTFFDDLERRIGVGVDLEMANRFRKEEIYKDIEVHAMVKKLEAAFGLGKKPTTLTLFRGEGGLNPSSGLDAYGKGKYFSMDKEFAATYGKVKKYEVSFSNPYIISNQKRLEEATNRMIDGGFDSLSAWAEAQGYDGIIDKITETVVQF